VTEPTTHTAYVATLRARREQMNLAINDVASRLLLSSSQVRALEAGDPKLFYNDAFYQRALKQYQTLLGLPASQAGRPEPAPHATVATPTPAALQIETARQPSAASHESVSTRASPSGEAPPVRTPRETESSSRLPTLLILAALVAGIYALTHLDELSSLVGGNTPTVPVAGSDTPAARGPADAAPEELARPPDAAAIPESQPAQAPADTAANVTTTPTPAVAAAVQPATPPTQILTQTLAPAAANAPGHSPSKSTTAYQIEARDLCWVFARDADGKESEMTLKAGERASFSESLTFLAVGNIEAVSVRVDGVERNLAPLSKDGRVVRLRQGDLETLRSGAATAPVR